MVTTFLDEDQGNSVKNLPACHANQRLEISFLLSWFFFVGICFDRVYFGMESSYSSQLFYGPCNLETSLDC